MSDTLRDGAIDKALDILGEHFDSVQILASYNEESETRLIRKGCGNWYARIRMCEELIIEDDARLHHRIKEEEYSGDDNDEE